MTFERRQVQRDVCGAARTKIAEPASPDRALGGPYVPSINVIYEFQARPLSVALHDIQTCQLMAARR